MKKIELIKTLEIYPVFTLNDFVRITRKSPEYCRTCLFRLKKEGLVFRVERGKYTVHDDPMAFASHIVVPSYISFWTALKFYNFTEQLPSDMMLAFPKSKKTIESRGTRIRFFKMKHMWGYGKQRYRDFDIFVAEKEKCIIDSLMLRNIPFDEVAKAVLSKDFDGKKLAEYAARTNNKTLAKRLGYLMELSGLDTGGLAAHLDGNYVLLDWTGEKRGKRIKRWKIIENRRPYDIA